MLYNPLPPHRQRPNRKYIIRDVIKQFGLTEDEFYSKRRYRLLSCARREACCRLTDDGAFISEIARLLKVDHASVRCHILPAERQKRRDYFHKRWYQWKSDHPEKYSNELNKRRKYKVGETNRGRPSEVKRVES